MNQSRGSIYNYAVFITFAVVCIHACGEPNAYDVQVGTLAQVQMTEGIVYQIASSEFPDAHAATMPYSVTIAPSGNDCPSRAVACTKTDGMSAHIYVYQNVPYEAMASLAHELIHVIGWSQGLYLGCPDKTKRCDSLDWYYQHNGPYFINGPHSDCTTWEHCTRVFLAEQLFPEGRGGSHEQDLEACYAAYGR